MHTPITMNKFLLTPFLLLSLFATSCSDSDATNNEPANSNGTVQNKGTVHSNSAKAVDPAAQQVDTSKPAAITGVHDVKCGCSIAEVGKCGNYILIDGKYVPMLHPSLGKMEFCAQKDKGAKVETKGDMADGKFVAREWQLVE